MTFTVLARDPRRGLIGAATASRSLAVGASVIAVDPAVGAVASQAWTNRALRAHLLDAMRAGESAARATDRVPLWDNGAELRQVAALPWIGEGAARSGDDISAWAGDHTASHAVFVGNLLAGPAVLDAMVEAWAASASASASASEDLAERLLAVLDAADAHGGDTRGRQSAALLVSTRTEIVLDLRVDDHPAPSTSSGACTGSPSLPSRSMSSRHRGSDRPRQAGPERPGETHHPRRHPDPGFPLLEP